MTISVDEAADIAREHGLTLSDAQALATLADDAEHANTLAAKFAPEADGAAIADRIIRGSR